MTTEDYLERIACELYEFDAMMNCRMDSLREINDNLEVVAKSLQGILLLLMENP